MSSRTASKPKSTTLLGTNFVLSDVAYSKTLLHTAKFPHSSCFGLLLGREDGTLGGKVDVLDCVPVAHGTLTSPIVQVATMLVEAFAEELKMKIVGCYFAQDGNEVMVTEMMTRIASALAVKVKKGEICLLVVNNKALGGETSGIISPPLICHVLVDKTWVNVQARLTLGDTACAEKFKQRLGKGMASEIMDVDDSMEDVSRDWRNLNVVV